MAFGLSDTGKAAVDEFLGGAPAIIDKLNAAGHTLEADAIQSLHAALTDSLATAAISATALETKTLTDLAAIVAPGIAQLTRACDLLERIQKGGMVVTVSFPS